MTHIVSGAKTKKELKEKLAANPARVYFDDPSLFSPKSYRGDELPIGVSIVCTNHPKRSWFASVTRTEKGFKVT